MLWWYEREDVKITVEVLQLPSGQYELHVLGQDGVDRVEYFDDATELAKRQQEIQTTLISDGWKGPNSWIV